MVKKKTTAVRQRWTNTQKVALLTTIVALVGAVAKIYTDSQSKSPGNQVNQMVQGSPNSTVQSMQNSPGGVQIAAGKIDVHAVPRTRMLTIEAAQRVIAKLSQSEAKGFVSVDTLTMDGESQQVANALTRLFRESGFKSELGFMMGRIVTGELVVSLRKEPDAKLESGLRQLFQEMGLPYNVVVDSKITRNSLSEPTDIRIDVNLR